MTPEEKQAELIRYRDILLATLDYLNLRYSGGFVTDDWDPEEQEAVSPDGKRMVRVTQWRKGKHASTSVSLLFETANGPVYGTTGNHPDIRASWKDNNTVVIETRRDYFVAVRQLDAGGVCGRTAGAVPSS